MKNKTHLPFSEKELLADMTPWKAHADLLVGSLFEVEWMGFDLKHTSHYDDDTI